MPDPVITALGIIAAVILIGLIIVVMRRKGRSWDVEIHVRDSGNHAPGDHDPPDSRAP